MSRSAMIRTALTGTAALAMIIGMGTGALAAKHAAATLPAHKVSLRLVVETGAMDHHPGDPMFFANGKSSARISLPAHTLVQVTFVSYDDGPAPVTANYARVQGTVGGYMVVGGKRVKSIKPSLVAHTFTVTGLRLNVPIAAAASSKKPVVETFSFVTGKAGTYSWQCYAPCGTGSVGWGGPMMKAGSMQGEVAVH